MRAIASLVSISKTCRSRFAAIGVIAALLFGSQGLADPTEAHAAKRGTCAWTTWATGARSAPSGPVQCETNLVSKYAYGAAYYTTSGREHDITGFDLSANRNGVGGATSNFPRWRRSHVEFVADRSRRYLGGQSASTRRTEEWQHRDQFRGTRFYTPTGTYFTMLIYYYPASGSSWTGYSQSGRL